MNAPSSNASEGPPPSSAAAPPTPRTVGELLALSQVDLYQLFQRSSPGPMPSGRGRGSAIALPGTAATRLLAAVFGRVAWQGKVFHPESEDLKNLVSPFGIPAIRARVRREESWLDGRECIVLDYSQTSRLFGWVRDEIREVTPGLYLGLVYGVGRFFGGRRLLDVSFVLHFAPPAGPGPAGASGVETGGAP